ncbi:MAG: rhomboid family intramembrane serine protease [Firmicutes bacterium]|nr:rhomboid family intramembrane serine protease [Bacillota bacterium]
MSKPKIVISFNAPATLVFALLSLAALLLGPITGGWTTSHIFMVYPASFRDPLTFVRLFCHVLGHSGYSHYIGNMLYILLLGPGIEEKYGSGKMVSFILITAGITGAFHMLFGMGDLLGASGIVFMLIVLSSFTSVRQGEIPLTAILVLILYLGQEIINGVTAIDSISQITHIIGGVTGFIFGLSFKGKH